MRGGGVLRFDIAVGKAAAVAYIRAEMDKWWPVVEATGIKSD